ncbi:hypothetical protein [uncultured Shewanella sp.]|uniref:hypothetical protein n=1 Tax=uncultured Shewanella sp. TaxID=173975 RepID=UPI002634004F|nr:hypothetical protein [uncultured Shewanella sp.]
MIALIALVLVLLVLAVYIAVVKKLGAQGEKYSAFASAFQHLFVVISIIFTAAWTLQTFDVLNQKEKAEADLKELQERINNTESTNIIIDTQVVDYVVNKERERGVIIDVTIKNQGKSKVSFDLSNSPLKIYQVEASGVKIGSKEVLKPKLYRDLAELGRGGAKPKGKNVPIDRWISLASSERTLSYFVTLKESEMYYIVFSSKAIGMQSIDAECHGESESECDWFVSKYFFVGGKNR